MATWDHVSMRSRGTSGQTCLVYITPETSTLFSRSMPTLGIPEHYLYVSLPSPQIERFEASCLHCCDQNGLLQSPDVADLSTPLTVFVLPALPSNWPSGSITGAKVRGGLTLSFAWGNGKVGPISMRADPKAKARTVNVVYEGKTVSSFVTSPGTTKVLHV